MKMKLILTKYENHVEVEVMDGCLRHDSYSYDNMKQAEAFCSGFSCAKNLANSLVQSLPIGYEKRERRMDGE